MYGIKCYGLCISEFWFGVIFILAFIGLIAIMYIIAKISMDWKEMKEKVLKK